MVASITRRHTHNKVSPLVVMGLKVQLFKMMQHISDFPIQRKARLSWLTGWLGVAFCLTLSADDVPAFSDQDIQFFERRIRPVLAESCYTCHSHQSEKLKGGLLLDSRQGFLHGGDSGSSIDLGQPERSSLLEAIRYQNVDLQMPPKTKLKDEQIRDFETWVAKGLPWPDEPEPTKSSSEKDEFDLEERKAQHWVWNPPVRHALPDVKTETWGKQPIDRFLLNRMEREGIEPALPADKRTLLRRTYLILTGLPPSPDQVDAFLADQDENAYDKVVDRLLDSVAFGERWARHWLDLVRYAETMGHEFDYEIPNAWRYRDYVIRAFNEDVPFNQFAMEHIAGDLLEKPRRRTDTGENESVIGTGFYWLGQQVHSPVDIRMNQLDVLDNQIDVLSKTFQALTVTCARCHDHKFDAITTQDFYGLFGVLKSSRYQQTTLSPSDRIEPHLDTLHTLQSEARGLLQNAGLLSVDTGLETGVFDSDIQVLGDMRLGRFADWLFDDEALKNDPFVKPGDLVSRPGEHAVKVATRESIDSAKWSTQLQGSLRSPTFDIKHRYLHVLAAGHQSRVNVVIDNFNLIRAPIYGGLKKNLDKEEAEWKTFDLDMWGGHEAYVELKDTVHADLSGGGAHGADAWFSVESVVASADSKPPGRVQADFKLEASNQPDTLAALMEKYGQVAREISIAPVAVSMTDGNGVDESVFIRGNPKRLGDPVRRGFISALKDVGHAPQGSGRLDLAKHITSPDNPLTARVYVNRVWHHLFGQGIVPTVDDFGVLGQRPSHPELLDWLAVWFMNEGRWSTKKLVRMLVLSSAFQMDSVAGNPEMDQKDAGNVLLHKMRVRRLEGESIRDAILKVSGRLDPTPFGPSEKIHLTSFMTGRGRPGKSGELDGGRRRSIYVEVRRNFLSPFLTTFDTPIPFTTFGRRAQSNVPAQSLILMNDPFVLQQSEAWAERVIAMEGSFASKLTYMYETALGRLPTSREMEAAREFVVGQQSDMATGKQDAGEVEKRLWTDLCHVIFNIKEFIYIH